MKKTNALIAAATLLCLSLSSWPAAGAPEKPATGGNLDTEKIGREYAAFLAKSYPQNKIGEIHIEALASASFRFSGVAQAFQFYRLRATAHSPGLAYDDSRLLALAQDAAGNQAIFFDTGFFMAECGLESPPNLSFGEVDKIQLDGKPVLVVEVIARPISCADVSTQETRKTLMFSASAPYAKVFETESAYVNFHDDDDHKPAEHRKSMVYPEGCMDFTAKDCAYLVVRGSAAMKSYHWNKERTQLVQGK